MASCELCTSLLVVHRSDVRFSTKDDARRHVSHHLLQTKHFDDDNSHSLEQLFEQGFPNFIVTPATKQKMKLVVKKEGRQSILNVCRTVLNGRVSKASSRVACQKCGSSIMLYCGKKRILNFGNAINHASFHLGFDMFECRKCLRSFGSRSAVCNHLVSSHGLRCLSEYYTDKSGDFIDEIITSIQQCFTEGNNNEPSDERARVIRRQSLLNVCQTLLNGRVSNASPRVSCQKCGSRMILYGGKKRGLRFHIAIGHASAHLGIDIFECRECGRSFGNKHALRTHLRATHGLKCLSEHFTDKSGDFIDEIITSIEQCFAEGNTNGSPDGKALMIRLKDEASVRGHTRGSKLAVERQLFCYRLIRQMAGDDGKIQCRLCPMRIGIKHGSGCGSQNAMAHVLVHLKKSLFRCKVCSNVRHTRGTMRLHLKLEHALPFMKNNYECLEDQFHAEVLDMVRKCYAEEPGK